MNLGALIIRIWMATAAGFATARRVGSIAEATLSGVLVGVIAGCALLALLPFASITTHGLQELSARWPRYGLVQPWRILRFWTPPPGLVIPMPRSGFFTTSPPPEAFAPPPVGFAGLVFAAIGALFTIGVGTGLAAGAAALAGLAGASRF